MKNANTHQTEETLSRFLSPHLWEQLQALQAVTGKSVTRLVREAVSLYLAQHAHTLQGLVSGNGNAPVIRSVEDAANVLLPCFAELVRCHLVGLFLNRHGAVCAVQVLETDCDDLNRVPMRSIMQPAVLLRARAMVLAHNHTNGVPIPSDANVTFTRHVAQAAAALGLVLIDHLIVANGSYASLFDESMIPVPANGYNGVYRPSGR